MIGSHNTNINISFFNDRVKEIIAADLIAEPFTYVPIKAGHMELVGGNAIVLGKITEGYDITPISIKPEIAYASIAVEPSIYGIVSTVTELAPFNSQAWSYPPVVEAPTLLRTVNGVVVISIPFEVRENARYYVRVQNSVEGIDLTAFYRALLGDTNIDIKTGLDLAMTAAGMEVEVGAVYPWECYIYPLSMRFIVEQNGVIYNESGDISFVYKDWTFTCYILDDGLTVKHPTLKCGATHGYGIVYKDNEGRTCSVVKTKDMNVQLPFYTETDGPGIDERAVVTFNIYHKPPLDRNGNIWATSYEIVYFGNISMDWFVQMRIDDIVSLAPYGLSSHYGVNIQASISLARGQNSRWRVTDYVHTEGDRIRLMGTIDSGTGVVTKYDDLYDYEIAEEGTVYGEAVGGDYLYFQATNIPVPFVGEVNIIGEIYQPRRGLLGTTPYGTGMVFEIGIDANGNQYHKGDVDQVLDADGLSITPAEVINDANDSYKYKRLNYKHESEEIQTFWCESISPSDWWTWTVYNKLTSNGFPFLDDLSQKQVALDERIRNGGFIITGTRTNNLAHFTFDDYEDLPKKNGDITGLREVGYTLKVLQMYKETSIYINRIQNFNADGTEQFTLTDRFLGSLRPMESDHGCQHPQSVMVNGRNMYYWDNNEGALIRSAPNGQVALSSAQYKVSRWFKDTVKWIQTSGRTNTLSINIGANNDYEEVWLAFRIGEDVKGIIFSEKDGRFKSRIDQKTEAYIHLGVFFAHAYRQRIWIMSNNGGQDYLSWGGTPVHAELEFVSNINPEQNKVFDAISVYSDHQWTSESKSIMIPEEASAVNEIMESNVSLWDRREGIFYGEILKDENSKGTFVSVNDKKMNGREMRGRYCFMRFKSIEHRKKVRFNSIVVFSTGSERSI